MKPKNGEPRYFVVYVEADQYLSLNDVQAADVLLSVVTGLWEQVHEHTDLRLDKLPVLTNFFGAIAQLFGAVNVELTVGIAKVKTDLKRNPNNRQILRDHIREKADGVQDAINELVEAVREGLQPKGYEGLVIIFDNLDRMVRRQLENSARTNQEALYIDNWDALSGLDCHLIYTLPTAVCHTPAVQRLHPVRIPMIPVTTRTGEPNTDGLAKLREMIERRAGGELAVFFDSDSTLERLCKVSGGFERQLIELCRRTLFATPKLPITGPALEEAIRHERDNMATGLGGEGWKRIREISAATLPQDLDNQLLEYQYVLEYRDADGYWCAVNPLIREAAAFTAGGGK